MSMDTEVTAGATFRVCAEDYDRVRGTIVFTGVSKLAATSFGTQVRRRRDDEDYLLTSKIYRPGLHGMLITSTAAAIAAHARTLVTGVAGVTVRDMGYLQWFFTYDGRTDTPIDANDFLFDPACVDDVTINGEPASKDAWCDAITGGARRLIEVHEHIAEHDEESLQRRVLWLIAHGLDATMDAHDAEDSLKFFNIVDPDGHMQNERREAQERYDTSMRSVKRAREAVFEMGNVLAERHR